MKDKPNICGRLELLLLGLRKGIITKDGKINGKAVSEMSYEDIENWIEKLKGGISDKL